MKSSPKLARFLVVPARKPSPNPTSSSSDPTPQAIPNMVRKERSLCDHMARNTSPRLSKNRLIFGVRTLDQQSSFLLPGGRHLSGRKQIGKPQFKASSPGLRSAMTTITVRRDAEHVRALAE